MGKKLEWDEVDLSDEEIEKAMEDARQYFENLVKTKKPDDYSFNSDYNDAIHNYHYEADVCSMVTFVAMQYKMDSLYLYFQYTKRFIVSYENIANAYYGKLLEEAESADDADIASDAAPGNTLTELNCQSLLLMLYSAFEAFLREIIEVVDKEAGILKFPQNDFTAEKYVNYLNRHNIFIPKKLFWQFTEVRLVRNYFAHSLEKPQKTLLKFLKNDPYGILKHNAIVVNPSYIEYAFELFGKLIKAVEIAYNENYE